MTVIEQYGELRKTKLTWIDSNGIRCIADHCYRERQLNDGTTEVVSVVTERADNEGMSVTNSADRVVNAISSRFPERHKLLITERYDARSHPGPHSGDTKARYAQYQKPDASKPVKFAPVHKDICAFFDKYWNDADA